jgi:adenosylhomocysteine nucleosidase
LIVVTGLRAEARIASAPGLSVFACGGDVGPSAHSIKKAVFAGAPAIVSFGVAGGLTPNLSPGDWVVATSVMSGDRTIDTDAAWSRRLVDRLPGGELGRIVSVTETVLLPSQKRQLQLRTGASAVDMESFQAAELAEELGLPFAAVRVIADPVSREIPSAARVGMQSDGTVATSAVMRSLLRRPSQLPSLIRFSSDVYVAFRALLRGRHELGPHFASLWRPIDQEPDLGVATAAVLAEPIPA